MTGPKQTFRTLLRCGVGCLLAAICVDAFLIAGLFVPIVVDGGSMAPGLCGPHRRWTCTACQREFRCGRDSLPPAGHPAICPYCFTGNDSDAGVDWPGDRVLVDRTAFAWRAPRRWEVVVLRCSDYPTALCVKRVVGLPMERVELRDGDVWIDGHLATKSDALVREMGVCIDDEPATGRDGAATWHWHDATGRWRAQGNTLVHPRVAHESQAATIDWLTYCRPGRSAADDADCVAILDDSPYDQSESRVLNPVHDVQVRVTFSCAGAGDILLRTHTHGDVFLWRLDAMTGRGSLERNGRTVTRIGGDDILFAAQPVELRCTIADGSVQMVIGGRRVLAFSYDPLPVADRDSAPLLALGVRRAEVAIGKLQVWRDVYYKAGRRDQQSAEFHNGFAEYFLLGDNSPHSQDSRTWSAPGVSRGQIVGRLIRW